MVEQLNAGKLRALAVTSRTRIESLPDVPTVAEAGYKDYEAEAWFGVVAPARTLKETVAQLAGWFSAAMQTSEIKAKLIAQGLIRSERVAQNSALFFAKKNDEYSRVIRAANIKAE